MTERPIIPRQTSLSPIVYTHSSASDEEYWRDPDGVIVQAIMNQSRRPTLFSRRFLVSRLAEGDQNTLNNLYQRNIHQRHLQSVDLRNCLTLDVQTFTILHG